MDEHDPHVDPLAVKGVGEIANAIYHTTGKRICSLPTAPDKLL